MLKPAFGDAVERAGHIRRSARRVLSADRPAARYRSARAVVADLADDVRLLEVKESVGEVLTPSERERLDAARSGSSGPEPAGGGS